MKAFEIIDYIQRRINSILFRLVLIAYSIVILILENGGYHSTWFYILITIFYLIVYILLKNYSRLRLINDFTYIFLILQYYNPNDIIFFSLLLLPTINTINFSGRKKSILLYVLTAATYYLLLFLHDSAIPFYDFKQIIEPFIPIAFLAVIDYYTSLRFKIRTFREELNDIVDSFFLKKFTIKRPHKIYSQIISSINENIKSNLIEQIICTKIIRGAPDRIIVINSSTFIWTFRFEDTKIIPNIREKKALLNKNIYLEDELKPYNLSIYIDIDQEEYIFSFITKSKIPIYYRFIGFFRTLVPALQKISKILISEKRIRQISAEETAKLSAQSQYVHRANSTMHFLRNRTGPFANLFEMLDVIDSVPTEKQAAFKQILIKEKERAKHELKSIVQRANYILEKSNNPFVYNSLNKISITRFFVILRESFVNFFPYLNIDIKITSKTNKSVMVNEQGFEIFLSDWLNNIAKYQNNLVKCEFFVSEEFVLINFRNNHNKNIGDINKMVEDLMSDNRNEIMKRTTHGLFTIKSILEEMCIPFEIKHDETEKIIDFCLTFKTLDNESSGI